MLLVVSMKRGASLSGHQHHRCFRSRNSVVKITLLLPSSVSRRGSISNLSAVLPTSVMVYLPKEYWWQSLLRSDSDSPNDLSAQLQRLTKTNLEPKGGIMGTLASF